MISAQIAFLDALPNYAGYNPYHPSTAKNVDLFIARYLLLFCYWKYSTTEVSSLSMAVWLPLIEHDGGEASGSEEGETSIVDCFS